MPLKNLRQTIKSIHKRNQQSIKRKELYSTVRQKLKKSPIGKIKRIRKKQQNNTLYKKK